MAEINWNILQPVDTGALVQQGFGTGMALVKHVQTNNALKGYLAHPDDPNAYSALAAYDPEAAATIQRQQMLRRKELIDKQDRERAVALGELAAQDPAGAQEEALKAGDFDLAKTFQGLSEDQQKKAGDFWSKAGPVAYRLSQTKDPEARKALWAQAAPMLASEGAPQNLLESFDPTNDTQIQAALAHAQTVAQLLDQGKVTWHQRGEFGEYATDAQGRPVGKDNPYAGGGGGGAVAPPPAAAVGDASSVLSSAGLPAPVVAGFLGNFHVEGGYTGAVGDGGSSHGIAQWNGERLANFQRVVGKPVTQASPGEQAKFVLWEMQNPEQAGMTVAQRDAILAAPDAATAASLIDQYYERSSGQHRPQRIAAAAHYEQGGEAVAKPRSKAELDALPAGTVFIAPDGSRRRKS